MTRFTWSAFNHSTLYILFSDDEFRSEVPRVVSAAPNPSRHPNLGDWQFPPFNEGPLSTIEKIPSEQKHSIINNKVRLAIKAMQPCCYGKGLNPHWAPMVHSMDLKSSTSLAVVGNRSTFTLEIFFLGTNFHMISVRDPLKGNIWFLVAGPSSR